MLPELIQAENGFYYIHWTENRRSKRVSTKTKDPAVAKRALANWLLGDERVAQDDGAETHTIATLWSRYETKHVDVKAMAADTAKFSWANLRPHFGGLTLAEVSSDTVEDYIEKRRAGIIGRKSKDSTIRRELNVLRACWNWCADPKRKIISSRDIPAFDLPDDGPPRDRWLRMEEVQKLLDAAAERRVGDRLSRGERFLWLALETGARKEAIWQLTWDRVDFDIGVIDFNVPGRRITKKRRAVVPISPSLRPVLERAYRERINDHVLDNEAEVWRIVKGIATAAGVEGVSPHVLRHTAATHMARKGVSLWKIAKILGNTLTMVERVYAKHCPDDLRESVGAISGGALRAVYQEGAGQ
jgi:integrase